MDSHRPADAIRGISTGALTRRMLMGAVLAVLGFALTYQLAVLFADTGQPLAIVLGSASALLVAAATMSRTISPIVASQADLQERYEAAVADALRDPLTGLGNHRAFQEELDRFVEEAARYQTPVALMVIDLDEFKSINDTRGHAGGDLTLRGFGQLLATAIRRPDRAYRVGGDEFAVILPHTDLESAKIVARRVLAQALQPSLRVEHLDAVSFSAGLSALPELAEDRAELFAQADKALYVAKHGGGTDVIAYNPRTDASATDADGPSASAIAEVIARGQLQPVYQPIVALDSGEIIGVEGLIRPVPPEPFADPVALFEAAEAGGRLVELDLACMEAIVRGADTVPPDQFLSLNLSPATVEAPEFGTDSILAVLARHDVPPERLVIELTEHQAIHDIERVRTRLDELRVAGIRIAADDIGAGNAGLRLMAEISFDIIKVDLGLVQRSGAEGPSNTVFGSVVTLAGRMGAMVIAEGVEDAAQMAVLNELGIEAGQGYHLGRPGQLQATVPMIDEVPVEMSAWRESIGLPQAS